jgi:hypothetical protein
MKYIRVTALICLWVCIQTHPVWACRYNVRETGFADLGVNPYRLYGYVHETTPEDIVFVFKETLFASLKDSNIMVEMINIDQQKDHPALKYHDLWLIQSYPSAVLISPDGQSLAVPFDTSVANFKQNLISAINDVVFSPTRDKILKQVIETYGVVLLIEGADTEDNRRTLEIADKAINKIKQQMRFMPKTIFQPPSLIVMDRESLSREKILLWSLGLDVNKTDTPHVAVIYGRLRWIGPLFKGSEISEAALTQVLYIIGEDCECGLDLTVLQGTMLPSRWDEKTQALTTKALGFDPENPMIKLEISQILRKGTSSYPGVPLGSQRNRGQSQRGSNPFGGEESFLQKQLYFVAGLAVLIIIGGLFITFRTARKNP